MTAGPPRLAWERWKEARATTEPTSPVRANDAEAGERQRAAGARAGSPFLSTEEAAEYVGLAQRTLEKMRVEGGGPKYRKHGRYVRYHIDELDAWSKAGAKSATCQI